MKKLTELANKYGTDKGTDINKHKNPHGFTEVYDLFFSKFIDQKPIILEIGTYKGDSVKMMNEYYQSNCEIYCIDNNEKYKKNVVNIGDNIHFYNLDQGNKKQLEEFVNEMNSKNIKFNIIIDDGSHVCAHQIISILTLYRLLDFNNGYYILEDLHTSYDIKEYEWAKFPGLNEHYTPLEILSYFNNPFGTNYTEDIYNLLKSIKYVMTFNNIENTKLVDKANSIREIKDLRSITSVIKFIGNEY